ncbi:hypothetical protein [Staphylococcus phage vB_StaM_SA1]|nr:hypothetical protein [Staphylococcus phage vB_StaM_SA1]
MSKEKYLIDDIVIYIDKDEKNKEKKINEEYHIQNLKTGFYHKYISNIPKEDLMIPVGIKDENFNNKHYMNGKELNDIVLSGFTIYYIKDEDRLSIVFFMYEDDERKNLAYEKQLDKDFKNNFQLDFYKDKDFELNENGLIDLDKTIYFISKVLEEANNRNISIYKEDGFNMINPYENSKLIMKE